MSWSFRKKIHLGPIKTIFSEGGVGMSWGISGFRVGGSSNGRKYITVGISRTGFYFTKYLSKTIPNEQFSSQINQEQHSMTKNEEPWWKQKIL